MEGTGFLGTWPDHAGQGHVPNSQPAEKSSLSLWDTHWPRVRPVGHGEELLWGLEAADAFELYHQMPFFPLHDPFSFGA